MAQLGRELRGHTPPTVANMIARLAPRNLAGLDGTAGCGARLTTCARPALRRALLLSPRQPLSTAVSPRSGRSRRVHAVVAAVPLSLSAAARPRRALDAAGRRLGRAARGNFARPAAGSAGRRLPPAAAAAAPPPAAEAPPAPLTPSRGCGGSCSCSCAACPLARHRPLLLAAPLAPRPVVGRPVVAVVRVAESSGALVIKLAQWASSRPTSSARWRAAGLRT